MAMARRYTMTDVTTPGSSVQTFRNEISGNLSGKGYSDDSRMRSLFPTSPLHTNYNDMSIISLHKVFVDTPALNNYDFISTDINGKAYLKFDHPDAPSITMQEMNKPIEGVSVDNPYQGHPNLQVPSLNPNETRSTSSGSEGGLLRERKLEDGGFGTKNSNKNYASSEVRKSIGSYFTNLYHTDLPTKSNALGNSTMKDGQKNDQLSTGVNNFVPQGSQS